MARTITLVVFVFVAAASAVARAAEPLLVRVDPPRFEGDAEAGNPVLADVNGDAAADLIVPVGKTLKVFAADPTGRAPFRVSDATAVELPFVAHEIVAADFNRDGKIDLALASHDSYDVAVLLGDGAGAFAAATGSPFAAKRGATPHTHGLAAADFNDDANLDLVVANNDDGDLSLLLGDGRGAFAVAPKSPFPCGRSPYPIGTGDIDGDSHPDVLVPNSGPGLRTLTVLRGDGRGALSPAPDSPITIPGGPFFAAAGDLNGDTRAEAVVTHNNDDGATILLSGRDGRLTPAPGSPLKLGHQAWGVQIIDMNADGHTDLVAAADEAVRVFLGDGAGRFRPARGSPFATGKGAWRLSVGDVNADGRPDVVTRCVEAKRLDLYLATAAR